MSELRKNIRFTDFGRIECEKICALPGVLCDISTTGLKVTFPVPIDNLDYDDEYELNVVLSKLSGESIKLLVIPMWRFDNNVNGNSDTQVGFAILPSLDYDKLSSYIDKMDESDIVKDEKETLNVTDEFQPEIQQEEDTPCQFL